MSTAAPPPAKSDPYNQTLQGFYGTFGSSNKANVQYLQSGLSVAELDKVKLVGEIEGSERWSVRDLFQRDVDTERVTHSILPYFRDASKVKFFNPITLTLLPFSDAGDILVDLPDMVRKKSKEDGREWEQVEYPGFYFFRYPKGEPQYGTLKFNDRKIRLVAIDGQHRVSALKRYKLQKSGKGSGGMSSDWTIPAVIFGLEKNPSDDAPPRILDVIRNIFVYINTAAKEPSKARQILLSDESVTAVCTQELLDTAHRNDLLDFGKRDKSLLPLLTFDWRGEEKLGRSVKSSVALFDIEEVREWLDTT